MLTDAELVIRKRCEKATPGPWFKDYQPSGPCAAKMYREQIITGANVVVACRPSAAFRGPGKKARQQEMDDGEFIAHAREDVVKLLATIESLRKTIADIYYPHSASP